MAFYVKCKSSLSSSNDLEMSESWNVCWNHISKRFYSCRIKQSTLYRILIVFICESKYQVE